MSSHELRRQLAELQTMVESLQPSRTADQLREFFAAAEYDGHREAIVAALLSLAPSYSFWAQLPDDPEGCPSQFLITWWDRTMPPQRLRIMKVREWRTLHGDLPELPTQLPEMMGEDTAALVASSDLLPGSVQGHSQALETPAPEATPASSGDDDDTEEEQRIRAEIAAIRARIRQIDAQSQALQQSPPSAPSPPIDSLNEPATTRREWWGKVF